MAITALQHVFKMKIFLLSILFLTSCTSPDCSNRAALVNAYWESAGTKTYIAVCPYGSGKSHAYLIVNNQYYDSLTLYRVERSTEGCIIFDDPEVLKPYMSKNQWEKEWRY